MKPLRTMTGYTKVYWNLIGDTETGTRKLTSAMSEGVDAWYRTSTGVEKVKAGMSGLVMSIGGLTLLKTSLDDIAEQFPKWYESWQNGVNKNYEGKYKYIYINCRLLSN